MIGLYNRFGRLKTRLRARLPGALGERLVARDPYLREHGVEDRKRQAWVMDQYRNPHESRHTMDEVLGWFDEDGVEFRRALPGTVFRARLLARLPALPVRAGVARLPPGSLAQPGAADAHRHRERAVRHDRPEAMSLGKRLTFAAVTVLLVLVTAEGLGRLIWWRLEARALDRRAERGEVQLRNDAINFMKQADRLYGYVLRPGFERGEHASTPRASPSATRSA